MSKELVAVYGSLRKGLYNHPVIEDDSTEYLGEVIIEGFIMRDYGSFPYIHHGEGKIKAEIYSVDNRVLVNNLDTLEGYPSFYNREQVYTPYGKAWIYFIDNEINSEYNKVESGDWKEYTEYKND